MRQGKKTRETEKRGKSIRGQTDILVKVAEKKNSQTDRKERREGVTERGKMAKYKTKQ